MRQHFFRIASLVVLIGSAMSMGSAITVHAEGFADCSADPEQAFQKFETLQEIQTKTLKGYEATLKIDVTENGNHQGTSVSKVVSNSTDGTNFNDVQTQCSGFTCNKAVSKAIEEQHNFSLRDIAGINHTGLSPYEMSDQNYDKKYETTEIEPVTGKDTFRFSLTSKYDGKGYFNGHIWIERASCMIVKMDGLALGLSKIDRLFVTPIGFESYYVNVNGFNFINKTQSEWRLITGAHLEVDQSLKDFQTQSSMN